MIRSLKGIIIEKFPPVILIDVNNIGYEVYMPMTAFYNLPDIKKETVIFTELIINQNVQTLFGFNNKQELKLFQELIKVRNIGPKIALVILSRISLTEFIDVVKNKKIDILLKIPGLGKKTANHLIIEMDDRLKKILKNDLFLKQNIFQNKQLEYSNKAELEAIEALIVLGYKPKEATKMITKIRYVTENKCESLIRAALRYFI